jgi:hypothetical protein
MQVVAFIVGLAVFFFKAFVVQTLFNWFLAGPLGTHVMTFTTSIMFLWVVTIASFNIHVKHESYDKADERISAHIMAFFVYAFLLGISWLMHLV